MNLFLKELENACFILKEKQSSLISWDFRTECEEIVDMVFNDLKIKLKASIK